MKKLILSFLLMNAYNLFAQHTDYPIQGVPFTQVHLSDNFWLPRIKVNELVTIPASFERCEKTGRVNNFV
ncbi:MAG: glycoside hydrolase family 127 protein, partial [Bacteroidota bacterium]|nr:glycoside hydrolase family 127 protein [Bacteroidota bacterium]